MNMAQYHDSNRLARRPGEQGARFSVGDQAENDKLATGNNNFNDYERFFILQGKDQRLNEISAINLYQAVKQVTGQKPENMRRLQSNTNHILIQTANAEQSRRLRNLQNIHGAPVEITPHKTLNTTKGTVISRESKLSNNDELKNWLAESNIHEFRRIPLKNEHLELLILNFPGEYLPSSIAIGFETCRVRRWIPNPTRCFNCQKFGHTTTRCRGQTKCANCGSTDHIQSRTVRCDLTPSCVNCGEAHPAYDRSCQKWKLEKKVLEIKTTKKLSFPQARKLAEEIVGPVNFASVVSLSSPRHYHSSPPGYPTPQYHSTPRQRLQLFNHSQNHQTPTTHDSYKQDQTANRDHFGKLPQQMKNHSTREDTITSTKEHSQKKPDSSRKRTDSTTSDKSDAKNSDSTSSSRKRTVSTPSDKSDVNKRKSASHSSNSSKIPKKDDHLPQPGKTGPKGSGRDLSSQTSAKR